MLDNFLTRTDSYKVSHPDLYHPLTQRIHSYMESRGGKYSKTLFFGLQYYIMRYLAGVQVTMEKIDKAEKFWNAHFGRKVFDRKKWEYILKTYDGHLPLRICAIPEGFLTKVGTVLMTIENTDPHCFWLTNFTETNLMKVWYPTTIATQSYFIKQDVIAALEKSGDPMGINFKVHDFGYRGVSSEETAALGAAAHLLNFMGTDTVAGIELLMEFYGSDMCGFSIPATEHSITSSRGKDHEIDVFEQLLKIYPDGLIACVSDTYDIYNACENLWGGVLKDKIIKRDGCLVIRPDSGDYFEVVPKILQILWDKFGGTIVKGQYKLLDPHVRIIQGDGMNPETIRQLYNHIVDLGWSADNLAVGSGGGLLQTVNRDTQKFAIKCNAALIDNRWIDVFKDPVTDPGKKSKLGRYKTIVRGGSIVSVNESYDQPGARNILTPVFENGKLLKTWTLDDIKKNIQVSEKLD